MKALRIMNLLRAARAQAVIDDNHFLTSHLYPQAVNYWLIDPTGGVSEEDVLKALESSLKEAGISKYQIIEHEN